MDKKKKTNYNIQPYTRFGETHGRRTTVWYLEQVFVRIWHYFPPAIRLLDVGCGNGRMNGTMLAAALNADKIVCIDPIDQRKKAFFKNSKLEYRNVGIRDVSDGPYDIITFWASALIIFKNHGPKKILRQLRRLSTPATHIIILQARNNFAQYIPEIMRWFKVEQMFTTKDGSSICIVLKGWRPND